MLICLAIFYSSPILCSSISRFAGTVFKVLVLLVEVMASESLLFLKIRRMILFIVLIALFILWFFR